MGLELRTERLWLRPRTPEDNPAVIAGLNDWEVVRHLTVVPYPYTEAHAREWLSRPPLDAIGQALFAIDLPGHGLIGIVSLDDHLGYWLARPITGRAT